MDAKHNTFLQPPRNRKSVEVVNLLKEHYLNETMDKVYVPNATSTLKKLGYRSFFDSPTEQPKRNNGIPSTTLNSIESSLGLLDSDKLRGLGEDESLMVTRTKHDLRSLSFNPVEIRGRSTCLPTLDEESKENICNNMTTQNKNSKKSISMEDILKDANMQSKAVDEILKTSKDPRVSNIRMSLESYKQSMAGSIGCFKDSWNYPLQHFGTNNNSSGNASEMRDSMFVPANKIDMTKEELSWMKECGDLPVHQQSISTFGSDTTNCSKYFTRQQVNESVGEKHGERQKVSDISKMSVGNYFKSRSENINQILTAPSPEKKGPFPPLFDPDEEVCQIMGNNETKTKPTEMGKTFRKSSVIVKDLPFQTLSDDSNLSECRNTDTQTDVAVLTHVNNLYNTSKPYSVGRDLTNTLGVDETYGSPLSYSQIRQLMEKLETETPSILLDNMIETNKKNNFNKHVPMNKIDKSFQEKNNINNEHKKNDSVCNVSPTMPERSSFGCTSNLFHSTKHAEALMQDMDKLSIVCQENTVPNKISPVKANTNCIPISNMKNRSLMSKTVSNTGSSQTLSSTNEDISAFALTLKNSNSGSSRFTENSSKSGNTVVHVKVQSQLKSINEGKSTNLSNVLQKNTSNRSGIKIQVDGDTEERLANPNLSPIASSFSDTSRELQHLMSPQNGSVNNAHTPKNGKTIIPPDDWISPRQSKINNLSKECIAGQTPYKLECFDKSQNLGTIPCSPVVLPDADLSLNVPSKGDWVKIESNEEDCIQGISQYINLQLSSMCSRWLAVKFVANDVYVDGQLHKGIYTDILLIQIATNKILLKADSQNVCTFKVTPLILSDNIQININVQFMDIVTKASSSVKHVLKICSKLPEVTIKTTSNDSQTIQFPIIPENSDVCLPIVLYNDSSIDLSMSLEINCNLKDVFSIGSVKIISRDDADKILTSATKLVHKKTFDNSGLNETIATKFSLSDNESYTMSKDKKSCFKVLIYYRAPPLSTLTSGNDIQYIEAKLNVSMVLYEKVKVPLQTISIIGGVGFSNLFLRNKQKSDILLVNQGSSEDIEMLNAGNISMEYNLFMANYYEVEEQSVNLVPSVDPLFIIDKSIVTLRPKEKCLISVSYPLGQLICVDNRRLLVFESPFKTEVFQIVGVAGSRSSSQQSTYSIDSAMSQAQGVSVKCTKRELSWGSLRLGVHVIQDIVFKNPSNDKKLKLNASINEDSFKIISEKGPVSSLMFSLLPQECRTLRIRFLPIKPGGHTGSLDVALRTNQTSNILYKVFLHGVGEISMLVFRDGIFRHGGTQGLPLGSLKESAVIKDIYFSIWNKGASSAFVMLALELKWKYRTLSNEVEVIPERAIIPAGEVLRCVVRVPRRALLLARGRPGDLETLAALSILHGDETTRQRIKRICSEHLRNQTSIDMWNEESLGKLKNICNNFPNEIPDDCISNFRESPDVLKQLLDELQEKEVTLTYDLDLDNTFARLSSELDETLQFHSICVSNTLPITKSPK